MEGGSLHRLGCYLRTKWASPRRIRFWLVLLVVLYTLLGFFGAPWMIQYFAEKTVTEDYDRELSIASVQTNPYTLTVRLSGVALHDTDSEQLLGWEQLFVDMSWSSITHRAWTFTTIQLDAPVIQEERFVSGETRWSRLAAQVSSTSASEQTPATEEPAVLPALQISSLQINNGSVRFTDHLREATADASSSAQAALTLEQIGLSLSDFSLEEGQSFPVSFNGQLQAGGQLALDGTLQLLPTLAFDSSASIRDLALKQAEPYLRQVMNVQLESGTLTVDGQLQTDAQQPFALQGSAGIDDLDIKNGANGEALIGWQSVQTPQFSVSLNDQQLKTESITVDGLSGKVVIYADQTTNFGQLVNGDAQASDSSDAAADATADATADASAEGESAAPFAIVIEGIKLNDGGLQFADNSLPLPFSTRIHALNGELTTLSSTSAEPARVNLEGEVAEYGLVTVDGAVNAWDPMRETNVQLRFRNLQVPEYSPYTVNFAGRKIAGGTMDLDLDYSIDDSQLEGENNLVLHDLKLGEKMASSDAMDLPLNLAIALLQDSNGVIDLTLPVTGDVGNPQFDFSKIIRQAIGNAITSVVTAPFSFLASLVGFESDDLGRVEFAAGRMDLLPPQQQRVNKLREALNQRPQLVLELAGPYSRDFDAPLLQKEKAVEELQLRLAEAERAAAEPSLTAEANQDLVEAMFQSYYSDTPLAELIDYFTAEPESPGGEAQFDALAYRNYLAEQIIDAQNVTEAELKVIGNARAQAVYQALVSPQDAAGVAAERVRLLAPEAVDVGDDDQRIAMEIGVSAG
ncbi:DUF748 domain-containing protein [Pseudidiomarina sp. 1ASP75-14]|uniref:DUF748 domain-containing protein n=1 Tax=Pseudidiomarina terrestris TaxID=2820060 RepID=UPI00264A8E8B|nr:DUF748 domain-containing protein [Pseudidiomarina sp. 1ASP75-14]MDN7136754.1 DUF748 domain-containing protein [Pseudidiomarina sp. 1ASP75-14]